MYLRKVIQDFSLLKRFLRKPIMFGNPSVITIVLTGFRITTECLRNYCMQYYAFLALKHKIV